MELLEKMYMDTKINTKNIKIHDLQKTIYENPMITMLPFV